MTGSLADEQAAHKQFSVACFNQAWDLLDTTDRTAEQDEEMLRLSVASTWHWTKRTDCTEENLSVGLWQTSRIHSVLGHFGEARRYAAMCVQESSKENVDVFFLAYAYEAVARAEAVSGNGAAASEALTRADELAGQVKDEDSRSMLKQDLEGLRTGWDL